MRMQIFKILSRGLFSTFCDVLSFYSENLLVPIPTAFIHVPYLVYFTCIKMTVYFFVCDILFGIIEYT